MITWDSEEIKHYTNVVYSIENLITGDCYVGETSKTLIERIVQHTNLHSKKETSGKGNRTTLYEDANKIGWNNFKVSLLNHNIKSKAQRTSLEKHYRSLSEKYSRYSQKDLNRDTSPKNTNKYIKAIDLDGTVSYYERPILLAKKLKCDRSNVLHSLEHGYKLKRRFHVSLVSEQYFMKQIKQTTLF